MAVDTFRMKSTIEDIIKDTLKENPKATMTYILNNLHYEIGRGKYDSVAEKEIKKMPLKDRDEWFKRLIEPFKVPKGKLTESFLDMILQESKTISEALNEENFCQTLEKEFRQYFPNGYFYCERGQSLGLEYFTIAFGMVKNEKDLPHNIRQNDPMYHKILVYINGDDDLEINVLQGGLYVKPEVGSWKAMDLIKTGFRNVKKTTFKNTEKKFKTFFKKLHTIVKDNQHKLASDIPTKYYI